MNHFDMFINVILSPRPLLWLSAAEANYEHGSEHELGCESFKKRLLG